MKSMKMSKSEQEKPMTVDAPSGDEYPWGLRLNLEQQSIKKLGMKELPEIGSEVMVHAKAKVVGARMSENEKSLELQITDMEMAGDDDKIVRDKNGPASRLAKRMESM